MLNFPERAVVTSLDVDREDVYFRQEEAFVSLADKFVCAFCHPSVTHTHRRMMGQHSCSFFTTAIQTSPQKLINLGEKKA